MGLIDASTEASPDERAFLQRRVAAFGRIVTLLFGAFLLYRLALGLFFGNVLEWTVYWHIVAVLGTAAPWLLCRGGTRSVRTVRVVETASLFATSAAICLMTMRIPVWQMPNLVSVLVLSIILFARAIFVPSSARRSGVLAGLIAIPLLTTTYATFAAVETAQWIAIDSRLADASPERMGLSMTLYAAAYWLITVVLTAVASQIIYGLRRQVRDARQLGQYRLEEKLGEGGMGLVYRARHAMLRRPTAVKLLTADRAGEKSLARFEREVQLTASLSHPNTINVFDYGRTPDGVFYYAMELINGATLSQIVDLTGAQPAARVSHFLRQICAALVEAHGIRLIHRDIKPANIMVHRGAGVADLVKVLDFGLVKEIEGAGAADLTGSGNLAGTPQYMAPEAIRAPETVDGRSDIYAVGAVGYFLITGENVFVGSTVVEVCAKHLGDEPEPPSQRLGGPVSASLERLLLSCLAKEPAARPQSAADLLHQLERCDVGEPWTANDAAEWWEEFGPALETERRKTQGNNSPLTLEIGRLRERGSSGGDSGR